MPQPWRSMFHRYYYGDHWCDLYETYDNEYKEEDSFDALCRFESQITPDESMCSVEIWLQQVEYPIPPDGLDNPTGRVCALRAGNILTPLLNLQVFPGIIHNAKYRKGTHPTTQKTRLFLLTSILWEWGQSPKSVKLPACLGSVPSAGNCCM